MSVEQLAILIGVLQAADAATTLYFLKHTKLKEATPLLAKLFEKFGPRLTKHEQAHWAQYERMGLVRFYVRYLWLTLRHGYRQKPMEIEARAAELKG